MLEEKGRIRSFSNWIERDLQTRRTDSPRLSANKGIEVVCFLNEDKGFSTSSF